MAGFEFKKTRIEGLTIIKPSLISDQRGYLSKTFQIELFSSHGICFNLAEELESKSCRHTLRGLHFQWQHSQDKLVRVLSGEIYDVAVDLRPDSTTFGQWQGVCLSADNKQILYLPKKCAHGFLVLSEEAVVHYLCGDYYDPDSEDGILWNDPELNIAWPLGKGETPILSHRDKMFQSFADFRREVTAL